MVEPKQGSIVWAHVRDHRQNEKLRPLVVITHASEIILDQPVVGVAITTTFPSPPTAEFVELPWHAKGHPATGLKKRSAAACNWRVSLLPSNIVKIQGYVPDLKLLEIIRRISELMGDS